MTVFRLSMLIVVYVLLVFVTYGQVVLDTEREYQHIERIQASDIVSTGAYTITNQSTETAIYTLGLYLRTQDRVKFPYRLVYQDTSQTLEAGESIVVYPREYLPSDSTLPDTLVINSTGTLTVQSAGADVEASASKPTWLPRSAVTLAQAFAR